MSSDVVLTSALRSNLLSLQNTQRLIDDTQLRLATGLKVNSALDNPQNFFAAESLNNRASDLTRLLDGISQSIRTVQGANTGVEALDTLLNQADSIATSARDALSADGTAEASVTGDADLSGVTDLTDLTGVIGTDRISLLADDADGDAITLSSATVAITAGDSIEQFITAINDITNTDDSSQAFEASLTDDGFLQIKSLQGGNARIQFEDTAGAADLQVASALGFSNFNVSEGDGSSVDADERAAISFSQTAAITSQAFFETENGSQVIADRSTLLTALEDDVGTTLGFAGDPTDTVTIGIDGATEVVVGAIASLSVQGFIDAVNDNSSLNTSIRASFDDTTGQLSLEQIDSSISSIQVGIDNVAAGGTAAAIGFGFGTETVAAQADTIDFVESQNLTFGSSSATVSRLEEDYNTVLGQIDDVVQDASYRGVNLLAGDDLTTFFNEDRSSTLTTSGANFTSAGLGLSDANFRNETLATSALNEIAAATSSVRAFGTSIANDLSIIETRRNFTESTINTLEAGADDLTVADQNEEGANLLALQTRQTLGVTSLSLASQSQQAVLRLF